MALVEVIFRDRIGGFTRGQVAVLDSESVFFKALITGGKAEVVNPPDWGVEVGEGDSEPSEPAEPAQRTNSRRSRKKSEKSADETPEYSPEGYGGSGEFVENRESVDSGQDPSEDSVGRPEYQSDSEGDSGGL